MCGEISEQDKIQEKVCSNISQKHRSSMTGDTHISYFQGMNERHVKGCSTDSLSNGCRAKSIPSSLKYLVGVIAKSPNLKD